MNDWTSLHWTILCLLALLALALLVIIHLFDRRAIAEQGGAAFMDRRTKRRLRRMRVELARMRTVKRGRVP